MKKLFIAAILAVTLITSAFATDESKISITIRENFKVDFKGAENVDWTVRDQFVKASFVMNGEKVSAFYDYKGEMIGTTHYIAFDDLALKSKRLFAKKYGSYNVTEVVEYTSPEENAFYVSAENDKEALVLKISEGSSISVFTKTRKK